MTAARKLSPPVAAMHEDLLTHSPAYRLVDLLRTAGRPMTVAEVADAIDDTRSEAAKRLWTQLEQGRLERVAPGVYQYRDGASMPHPRAHPQPRARPTSAPREYSRRLATLPTHDRHGRRALMMAGSGPRREDCARYDVCVDIAAHVTTGDARCPAECPAYVLRDSRITERNMVSGHDRSEEYSV